MPLTGGTYQNDDGSYTRLSKEHDGAAWEDIQKDQAAKAAIIRAKKPDKKKDDKKKDSVVDTSNKKIMSSSVDNMWSSGEASVMRGAGGAQKFSTDDARQRMVEAAGGGLHGGYSQLFSKKNKGQVCLF